MNLDKLWWLIAATLSIVTIVIGFSLGSGVTEVIANIFAR